jgi:hypothetical protein
VSKLPLLSSPLLSCPQLSLTSMPRRAELDPKPNPNRNPNPLVPSSGSTRSSTSMPTRATSCSSCPPARPNTRRWTHSRACRNCMPRNQPPRVLASPGLPLPPLASPCLALPCCGRTHARAEAVCRATE